MHLGTAQKTILWRHLAPSLAVHVPGLRAGCTVGLGQQMKIWVQFVSARFSRFLLTKKQIRQTAMCGPCSRMKDEQCVASSLMEVNLSAAVQSQIQICGLGHGSSRLYRFRLGIMTSCTRSTAATAGRGDVRRCLATAAAPRSRRAAAQLIIARCRSTGCSGRLVVQPLVILLETGHNAQIRLALRAMVFRFAAQNASMPVDGVPTEVAAQRRTRSNDRTMTRTRILESDDLPLGLQQR